MFKFILVCFFLSTSLFASEGGSGGSSARGGTGVVCRKTTGPVRSPNDVDVFVLEDYAYFKKTGKQIRDFEIHQILEPLTTVDSHLKGRIIEAWGALGDPSGWSRFPKDWANGSSIMVDDLVDDFKLPKNCDNIQLVTAQRASIDPTTFAFATLLDQRGRNILRLHEAIYAVGDRFFGHRSAYLTRSLIIALNAQSGVRQAVQNFIQAQSEIKAFVGKDPNQFSRFNDEAWVYWDPIEATDECPSIRAAFLTGKTFLLCSDLIRLTFPYLYARCETTSSLSLNPKCGYTPAVNY